MNNQAKQIICYPEACNPHCKTSFYKARTENSCKYLNNDLLFLLLVRSRSSRHHEPQLLECRAPSSANVHKRNSLSQRLLKLRKAIDSLEYSHSVHTKPHSHTKNKHNIAKTLKAPSKTRNRRRAARKNYRGEEALAEG